MADFEHVFGLNGTLQERAGKTCPRVPDRKAGMPLRIDDYWERDGFTGDECGVIPAREDAGGGRRFRVASTAQHW